jgi:hypothetical protein
MNQGEGRGGMATKVLTSFTVDICSCDYNMYAVFLVHVHFKAWCSYLHEGTNEKFKSESVS